MTMQGIIDWVMPLKEDVTKKPNLHAQSVTFSCILVALNISMEIRFRTYSDMIIVS